MSLTDLCPICHRAYGEPNAECAVVHVRAPEPEPRPSEPCNEAEWDTTLDEGGTLLGICACGVPMADHDDDTIGQARHA